MIYGSVCSGIEAASVAWEPLGFAPAWVSEIDPFPSAVLAHHWPHVTNLGDMTKIATAVLKGDVVAPDILVGGTPCQAFSVAGAREGLADERGQLTISYGELADAIDDTRIAAGKQPSIIVWENVPGVLSSKDNAFGAFLGLLSGEERELVPPGGKWTNAGYVSGPKRAIAWRVLDAQYFGVAQRRRRVFVVASARTDFDPSKVLFEREGVRRDTPPSREAGKAVAALTANGVGTCGADDNQAQAGHFVADVSRSLTASHTATGRLDPNEQELPTSAILSLERRAIHLPAGAHPPAVAWSIMPQNSGKDYKARAVEVAQPIMAGGPVGGNQGGDFIQDAWAVRRLTPVECCRLQGFPDDHFEHVIYRGKKPADGPIYKALGNSMAVNAMRVLGTRIQMIEELAA